MTERSPSDGAAPHGGAGEVFRVALRLGLTAFGGPVAHIGYFRDEYVGRRGWIDERAFSELVAVVGLLPGPLSSQLGIAIGTVRAGKLGGLAAWAGFTVPSAIALTLLGIGIGSVDVSEQGWLHGLELVAVPVVLFALVGMARTLTPDARRIALAVAAGLLVVWIGGGAGQILAILAGGVVGLVAFRGSVRPLELHLDPRVSRRFGLVCLAAFGGLLVALPMLRDALESQAVALVAALYQAGALVFGGGHVVLPLLESSVVDPGWLDREVFLAGYGAAQAVPGPLFTFAAFVGAAGEPEPNGVAGAGLALAAIFLPAFLVLYGVLPLWSAVRSRPLVQAAVVGIGAAVVGILAAALWDPVLVTSVHDAGDVVFAAALGLMLRWLPPWAVVALAAAAGAIVFG